MFDIRAAVETKDPEPILWRLAHESVELAKKWAMVPLRPILEPELNANNASWDDAYPLLDAICIDSIKTAVETKDPDPMLWTLGYEMESLLRSWGLPLLRPVLEPELAKEDLVWDDVLPLLMSLCVEDLQTAVNTTDPLPIIWKLAKATEVLARAWGIAELRIVLEPELVKEDILWEDMLLVLNAVTVDEIQAAVETGDPDPILWRLGHGTGELAKHWGIAKLRPTLEPELVKENLTWADVVPVLDAVSVNDIQLAVQTKDPKPILMGLARPIEALGKKWALAKLRPILEPKLIKQNLELTRDSKKAALRKT